jgi:hypothetical protein
MSYTMRQNEQLDQIESGSEKNLLSVYREVTQGILADFRAAAGALLKEDERFERVYEQGTNPDEERMGMKGHLTIDLECGDGDAFIATVDSSFQHGENPGETFHKSFVIGADVAQAAESMLENTDEASILDNIELDDAQRMSGVVDNLIVVLEQSTDPAHQSLAQQLQRNSLRRYVQMTDAISRHIPLSELMSEGDAERYQALRTRLNS